MKHLKVWHKLALMGAVFIFPFAVVTYKMVSSVNTLGAEFARREMLGLEYYTPLLKLLQDLQQHRGTDDESRNACGSEFRAAHESN